MARTLPLPLDATADEATEDETGRRPIYAYALAAAVGLGVVVRAVPVLGASFPLNDGGLFCAMAADL